MIVTTNYMSSTSVTLPAGENALSHSVCAFDDILQLFSLPKAQPHCPVATLVTCRRRTGMLNHGNHYGVSRLKCFRYSQTMTLFVVAALSADSQANITKSQSLQCWCVQVLEV